MLTVKYKLEEFLLLLVIDFNLARISSCIPRLDFGHIEFPYSWSIFVYVHSTSSPLSAAITTGIRKSFDKILFKSDEIIS